MSLSSFPAVLKCNVWLPPRQVRDETPPNVSLEFGVGGQSQTVPRHGRSSFLAFQRRVRRGRRRGGGVEMQDGGGGRAGDGGVSVRLTGFVLSLFVLEESDE